MSEPRIEPRVATPGTINILAANEIYGKVRFVGGNAVGPHITVEFLNVMFRPANNAIDMIMDEWGRLEVTGEVLMDSTGKFGTVTHPDTTLVSPLVSQYYIGKGIVSMQFMSGVATPDVAYVDIGNVPSFQFTPSITTLPHFSSRVGVRSKDLEVITEKSATLTVAMEEYTYRNLLLAFLELSGRKMVSLVDIVPQKRTVETAAGPLELRGLGLRQIADLLLRFPNLRNLLTEGAPELGTETLLIAAPDAIAAIIAEAAGQPEAAESIADGALSLEDLAECLVVVRDLTMPQGTAPFLARLERLLGVRLVASSGEGPDMSAPKQLSNSSLQATPLVQ